jgi:hypothetical protein
MTPEERDLISGLFAKLKAADTPNKDREAESLIQSEVARLPSAPYLLAQTVLVQEQALGGAKARIEQLESQLKQAEPAPQSTSFLGGAARSGPWGSFTSVASRQPQPAAPAMPPMMGQPPGQGTGGPWMAGQQPMMGGGGGFLRSALTTAAGVAGGALLFEGIRSMIGYSSGPFSSTVGGIPMGQPTEIVERETVNNYYGGSARPDAADAGAQPDAGGLQDTDYQTDSDDDLAGGFDSSSDDSA